MENPVKMDDLGVPPFSETSIWVTVHSLFSASLLYQHLLLRQLFRCGRHLALLLKQAGGWVWWKAGDVETSSIHFRHFDWPNPKNCSQFRQFRQFPRWSGAVHRREQPGDDSTSLPLDTVIHGIHGGIPKVRRSKPATAPAKQNRIHRFSAIQVQRPRTKMGLLGERKRFSQRNVAAVAAATFLQGNIGQFTVLIHFGLRYFNSISASLTSWNTRPRHRKLQRLILAWSYCSCDSTTASVFECFSSVFQQTLQHTPKIPKVVLCVATLWL